MKYSVSYLIRILISNCHDRQEASEIVDSIGTTFGILEDDYADSLTGKGDRLGRSKEDLGRMTDAAEAMRDAARRILDEEFPPSEEEDCELFSWDGKEQPDWEEIDLAISRYDTPMITYVDGESDEYVIKISERPNRVEPRG